MKLFVATKAFILHNGKVLILRESKRYDDGSNPGQFDVPGGRVKPGQRFDESLLREIMEETGLDVKKIRPFHVDEWRPVVKGHQWQIVGTYFICTSESDEVKTSEDHDGFRWIDPKDYQDFNLIPNVRNAFKSFLSSDDFNKLY